MSWLSNITSTTKYRICILCIIFVYEYTWENIHLIKIQKKNLTQISLSINLNDVFILELNVLSSRTTYHIQSLEWMTKIYIHRQFNILGKKKLLTYKTGITLYNTQMR